MPAGQAQRAELLHTRGTAHRHTLHGGVYQHHVDADPDPIFYVDSDPISDPVPTPHFRKSKIVLNLFVYNSFTLYYLSRQC